ncbi:hypothetical protein Tco_1453579 [Tanacetum coccineum]
MITNQSPMHLDLSSQLSQNPSVSTVAGVATGDGTISSIMGDEIGEGTIEGDGEIGSKPDVQSGEGGV